MSLSSSDHITFNLRLPLREKYLLCWPKLCGRNQKTNSVQGSWCHVGSFPSWFDPLWRARSRWFIYKEINNIYQVFTTWIIRNLQTRSHLHCRSKNRKAVILALQLRFGAVKITLPKGEFMHAWMKKPSGCIIKWGRIRRKVQSSRATNFFIVFRELLSNGRPVGWPCRLV